jgi:hypothetical protein
MNIRKGATLGVILLVNQFTFADASYQETSQITGGTMVDALKSVSFIKSVSNMFAPTTTTTMVRGNQKAVVSKDSTEITDLDRETITRIDNLHKTYTVTTFAQMRQAIADMPKQMEQAQAKVKEAQAEQAQQPKSNIQTSFDVSAKNTGVTKDVNGLTAQEQVVTMQMHATDPSAPSTEAVNSMTYTVTTDAWIAPDPPEVKEIQDFDMRFGKKLMAGVDLSAFRSQMTSQNPGMAQLFGGKPGSAEAMAQMGKELAKLKGTRVLEVTRMGGSGTGPGVAPNSAQAPPPPPPSGGNVAGQVATDTAAQTAAGEASRMGVFGSALGSSALGAFHRKKAAAPAPTPAADTTTTTATAGDGSTTTTTTSGAVLMEMTMQKSNFSRGSVPESAFVVPAGYKKVESPVYGAGK